MTLAAIGRNYTSYSSIVEYKACDKPTTSLQQVSVGEACQGCV